MWVAPLLRSAAARTKDTALPGAHLWADMDGTMTPAQEAALARLVSGGALVVRSGRPGGRHLYVRLNGLTPPAELEVLNRRLAALLGADHKSDAASVLRLPGTTNHKWSPPRPVTWEVAP